MKWTGAGIAAGVLAACSPQTLPEGALEERGTAVVTLPDRTLLTRFQNGLLEGCWGREIVAPQFLIIGDARLSVQQQPKDNPEFVTQDSGKVSQFQPANEYGVLGIIAHNYLEGARFLKLTVDREVVMTGSELNEIQIVRIKGIYRYQALDPDSSYSEFIELGHNKKLSSSEVFLRHYVDTDQADPAKVTLQTCFEIDGKSNAGRVFFEGEQSSCY